MYDYVIVGAGSAGCVLAARLSEDPDVSVLLLEAGPPDVNENIHVPLGYLQLARTEVDWDYALGARSRAATAAASRCRAARSSAAPPRSTRWSTSAATARDYDGWGVARLGLGRPLPLLPQGRGQRARRLGVARRRRAAAGLRPALRQHDLARLRRGRRSKPGLARNEDFNGAEQDGVGMYQVTQRGGMRASAAVAYLHPAMERPNLTVMPYMHVNRVLFEGTRAVGVEASQLGQAQELRAEREVILCGGAYNSPQLLMLSGVGPAEHLAMREIEVLLDQPAVGENLSDHAATYDVWTTPEPESLLRRWSRRRWRSSRPRRPARSPPTWPSPAASPGSAPAPTAPDVQFHVAPIHIVDEGMGDPQAHGVWVSPCLLTPREPRLGPARLQRPDREADRPQRLLRRRGATWRG